MRLSITTGVMSAGIRIFDRVISRVGVSVPVLRVGGVWYNGVRLGKVVKIRVQPPSAESGNILGFLQERQHRIGEYGANSGNDFICR